MLEQRFCVEINTGRELKVVLAKITCLKGIPMTQGKRLTSAGHSYEVGETFPFGKYPLKIITLSKHVRIIGRQIKHLDKPLMTQRRSIHMLLKRL